MTSLVVQGDARRLPLPDASVDLIVTSPPYWALRSYTDGGEHYDGQIGSESSPQEWLDEMLLCTAEWQRVLKPTGSLWVNLGDKYSDRAGPVWRGSSDNLTRRAHKPRRESGTSMAPRKSLLGLPWRYAIACMDDLGLILRRDVGVLQDEPADAYLWHKPTPMPEAVTDRCRSSHEYLFHFTKQPRYYADINAAREPYSGTAHARASGGRLDRPGSTWETWGLQGSQSLGADRRMVGENPLGKPFGSIWRIAAQPLRVPEHLGVEHFAAFPPELARRCIAGWSPPGICTSCGQGRRSITDDQMIEGRSYTRRRPAQQDQQDPGGRGAWNGQGFSGQKISTIVGYVCACTPAVDRGPAGAAWAPTDDGRRGARPIPTGLAHTEGRRPPPVVYDLSDWTPAATRPAVVLDPFGGSGTTALVAAAAGRIGISLDLSHDYSRLARWRTTDPAERAKVRGQAARTQPVEVDGQDDLFSVEAMT